MCAQGQLNVYGPAELSLVPELPVPAAKLALFQTACFNPTIAGPTHAVAQAWRTRLLTAGSPVTAKSLRIEQLQCREYMSDGLGALQVPGSLLRHATTVAHSS